MEEQTLDYEREEKSKRQTYSSIGGWLILPVIGLIITPVRLGYAIFAELIPALSTESLEVFSNPDSDYYNPGIVALLYGELIVNSLYVILAIVTLISIFRLKAFAPKLFIVYIVSNLAIVLLDHALLIYFDMGETEDFVDKELIRSFIGCAIWVPYFLLSERVKGTFVK